MVDGQHTPVVFEWADFPVEDSPVDFDTAELYEDRCENIYDEHGNTLDEPCGGRVVSTGGQSHYSNGYDCYTLYLECETCGPYEVECV